MYYKATRLKPNRNMYRFWFCYFFSVIHWSFRKAWHIKKNVEL